MADEENKKQFHIFISYRVNTDADLAEKLCDKLQALTILNEQREVRIKCFLDKQNLKEGVDYTSQFMTALTGSCLVLPIVSEACLKSMLNLQAGWTDNVLKEWQTALHFQSMDKLTIIPILVGANEVVGGSKVYRKFEGFTMVGQLPDLVLPDAINDHTVKQVIGNLFKLQGIFLNPLELTDKLAVIQSRFSSEVWPSYRTLWSNVAELGPEPQLTCVQCLQPYTESSNGDGACRFHLTDGPIQEYGRTYACCQLKDPLLGCHRNRHNPKHHNRFKYGSFVNWRAGIMWNTLMSRTHAKISADDYSEEYADETAWIRVGATTSNAGKDQNKLMIASAIPYESWFMLFEKEELIGVDTRLPVFSLKGQRDEYAIGRWIVSDEGHEVIGINIECGTRTSVSPSSAKVHFAWPEINDFNGPEATLIEFCKSAAFGERPLPKALQNIKNPYNLPTTPLAKGEPLRTFIPRKPDSLPAWKSPASPLKVKVGEQTMRHDAYRKKDYLGSTLKILNTSQDPVSIVEGRIYARLRNPGPFVVPETGDEEKDATILTNEWKQLDEKCTYFSIGNNNGLPTNNLPILVPAGGSVTIEAYAHLMCDAYLPEGGPDGGRKNYSWVALTAQSPVVIDVELEDVKGEVFGTLLEFCMPNMYLKEPEKNALFSLQCDDTSTANRDFYNLSIPVASKDFENCDPVVKRDLSTLFQFRSGGGRDMHVATLRHVVLEAEKQHGDKSHDILASYDVTPLIGYGYPYNDFNSQNFHWYTTALVDLKRRIVVGLRVKGVSYRMTTVGYFPFPEYGDVLPVEGGQVMESVDSIALLDEHDPVVAEWKKEESELEEVKGHPEPVKQEKLPIDLRVKFGSSSALAVAGVAGGASIDVKALAEALGPVIKGEIGLAIPEIVKQVEAAVQHQYKSAIDQLLVRIQQLEEERDNAREYVELRQAALGEEVKDVAPKAAPFVPETGASSSSTRVSHHSDGKNKFWSRLFGSLSEN